MAYLQALKKEVSPPKQTPKEWYEFLNPEIKRYTYDVKLDDKFNHSILLGGYDFVIIPCKQPNIHVFSLGFNLKTVENRFGEKVVNSIYEKIFLVWNRLEHTWKTYRTFDQIIWSYKMKNGITIGTDPFEGKVVINVDGSHDFLRNAHYCVDKTQQKFFEDYRKWEHKLPSGVMTDILRFVFHIGYVKCGLLKEETLKINSSPDFECPICKDEEKKTFMTTPCKHKFCMECWNEWKKMSNSCPMCRQFFYNY